jgi:hypothetical protein
MFKLLCDILYQSLTLRMMGLSRIGRLNRLLALGLGTLGRLGALSGLRTLDRFRTYILVTHITLDITFRTFELDVHACLGFMHGSCLRTIDGVKSVRAKVLNGHVGFSEAV